MKKKLLQAERILDYYDPEWEMPSLKALFLDINGRETTGLAQASF
ncbi:hypothetical protein [Eubacterium limosum]|nr:hypothetical protein [Eubacterium limosum]